MNLFEKEIIKLLETLVNNKVRFILVGGLAVNYYGYARTTADVDLWIEDKKNNRNSLVNALKELEIEGAEIFHEHPIIAGFSEIMLDSGTYIDLMADLQLLKQENFDECYEISDNFKIENVVVKVLHINKLIQEKENSNRLKDRDDAEQLNKLLKGRK